MSTASPAESGAPDLPVAPSPYADPCYGDAPHEPIHSQPTWSLEENQNKLTGWAAGFVICAGALLMALQQGAPRFPGGGALAESLQDILDWLWYWRHQLLILAVFSAEFLLETLVFKVQRRHFDFEQPRPVDLAAWRRILARWVAVAFALGVALGAYWTLGEYRFGLFEIGKVLFEGKRLQDIAPHYYAKYILFLYVAFPVLLVLCVPYFWMVERFARPGGPVDEFLVLARCLRKLVLGVLSWLSTGLSPGSRGGLGGLAPEARPGLFWEAIQNPHVHNLFRGLGVKFFYVPLMMIWCVDNWSYWEKNSHLFLYERMPIVWSDPHHVAFIMRMLHGCVMNFIIMIDLTPALVGYLASMRLLDTHVTSAEPTLFGWTMALLCYPPFNKTITPLYFPYGGNDYWVELHSVSPILSILSSVGILFFMGVYAWGTLAFGLRFSNLTNRGIVCTGPYACVRHPAYITKNLSWWIEAVPFIQGQGFWNGLVYSLHLAIINAIYFLRAWTEERHLKREPHYREYCKKVPWRFIPGFW